MNGEYYTDLIARLRKILSSKRGGTVGRKPLLLIDNTPIHGTRVVTEEISKSGFEKVNNPLYSPDMAPSDFYLFKVLKSWQRGRTFTTLEKLQSSVEMRFE